MKHLLTIAFIFCCTAGYSQVFDSVAYKSGVLIKWNKPTPTEWPTNITYLSNDTLYIESPAVRFITVGDRVYKIIRTTTLSIQSKP